MGQFKEFCEISSDKRRYTTVIGKFSRRGIGGKKGKSVLYEIVYKAVRMEWIVIGQMGLIFFRNGNSLETSFYKIFDLFQYNAENNFTVKTLETALFSFFDKISRRVVYLKEFIEAI